MRRPIGRCASAPSESGAALLLGLVLFAVIGVSFVLAVASTGNPRLESDRKTNEALAQAKTALIGYAVDVLLSASRLGELPCPDTDDDGTGLVVATGLPENCDAQDKRLGRLPWKSLGLPDLRDGDGERLWYAVSATFKRDLLTHCALPTAADCINSDSRGTISVRDPNGALRYDGTNPDPWIPSGAIAVIIAPGAALTRHGGSMQDRSPAGHNVAANYLDLAPSGEDNADFIDGSTNGFINGPVKVGEQVVVNDRIAVISYQDLIPALQRRVVREIGICLDLYAAANGGRYPWAADTSETALASESGLPFQDKSDTRAGRVPESLTNTNADSSGTMAATWPSACNLSVATNWWTNWKLHVFYALAEPFRPMDSATSPTCSGSCLSVNTPSGNKDARYLVLVAGNRLGTVGPGPGQFRASLSQRANPVNYLEAENDFSSSTVDVFELSAASAVFNDMGIFK